MQNIWRLAYPELGSVANERADSQASRVVGLKQTNYFDQTTEVTSAVEPALPGLPMRKGGKTSVSQLSEGQTVLANCKPLEMTPDNGCSSLVPIDNSTDFTESNIRSINPGPLGPATTEVVSHAPATSSYLTEISSNLQSNSPKFMASAVYESLIQHGCLDLMSSVDPLGFSTCAVAEGGFGDVWTGRFLKDGAKIGIKVLRFTLSTGDVARKELKRTAREIYNWSKLDHENVNKLIGVIMFRERLGMVSEWMEHGNLRQYLGRNNDADRGELCIQIARGVAYLHGVNMVHGDLKACNILVSSTGVIKITDFDYSIFPECSLVFSATSRLGGTLRWMAPELVLEEKPPRRNSKTDIYALGMTFLETITDAEPYLECEREFQIYRRLASEEHPERPNKHFPDTEWGNMIWDLLLRCWDFNPVFRPKSQDVLESLLAL
ncbi:Serine/threonine-protein kinase PAK 6 [Rhizoctonia solani]|uniref:Serine/threonine-protein kinase PAK 6 n=1 Tax=Rhizoctonia solani TaxID=456999 RepID=A0A0K6FMU3_9AGAM|nr:Serine/threonine-protein kinase PAK 6 [Rhizoctonia solani]